MQIQVIKFQIHDCSNVVPNQESALIKTPEPSPSQTLMGGVMLCPPILISGQVRDCRDTRDMDNGRTRPCTIHLGHAGQTAQSSNVQLVSHNFWRGSEYESSTKRRHISALRQINPSFSNAIRYIFLWFEKEIVRYVYLLNKFVIQNSLFDGCYPMSSLLVGEISD